MRANLLALVIFAGLALGCAGDDESPSITAPPADCLPGEWQRDDGACIPAGLPPDMPCPPGTWLREESCMPAGVPPDGCGEGFVYDGDGCEPILPAEPCPVGLMAVPGDVACRAVAPCASGTWGDIAVEPDTEYVDGSYAGMDSDGSALKPWPTIQGGVDAAAAGAIVAIAAGTYSENVTVSGKPVRLWGVCPSQVEVVGAGARLATIHVFAGASGTAVRGIASRGDAIGAFVSGSVDVLFDRVWIHDNASRGIGVESAYGPTAITLRDSLVEQNHEIGMFVYGSDATVEASAVRTTLLDVTGGRGVNVQPDATGAPSTLLITRSIIERNRDAGVYVEGSNGRVETSVVRGTELGAENQYGRGVAVQPDAMTGAPSTLLLRTSLVEQNHATGVYVSGSDVTIDTTVVRRTELDSEGHGRGVGAQPDPLTGAPSTLLLRTSLVDLNREVGVYVSGSDATLEASVVRATELDADGHNGRGISVQQDPFTRRPATARIASSVVEQNHEIGVFVAGAEATLEASIVRATEPDAEGLLGRGVNARTSPETGAPSTLLIRSSIVEENHQMGVIVESSAATVETSIVRGTKLDARGLRGRGVQAQYDPTVLPADLFLDRSVIEQSYESAVAIVGSAAHIDSCWLRDTVPNAEGHLGHGVMVATELQPASATITATRVDRSALAAVAAWGALISIGGSAFSCQAFDIDHENYQGNAPTLENLGGNFCGCPNPTEPCKAVSAGLEPPPPLEPTPD